MPLPNSPDEARPDQPDAIKPQHQPDAIKPQPERPPDQDDRRFEKVIRNFLETQAPDIVKSHSVPRNYAVIFGLIIVIATLLNFGTSVFFGLDQSRNLGNQTGIQSLAERAAVADVLSKVVNSLNQALADLDTVKNAFDEYSDGSFLFRGAKDYSRDVPRQNFVSNFCAMTNTAEACREKNIYELVRRPSLDPADGSQTQLAVTLEMLTKIDDAVSKNLGELSPAPRKSISGILKNAQNTCEDRLSGGAASQIEGSIKSAITPSSLAAMMTLSSAIDYVLRSARPLFQGYLLLRGDNSPSSASAADQASTDTSNETQIETFKSAVSLLKKAIKRSSDGSTDSITTVREFSTVVGQVLAELKANWPAIRSDCEQLNVTFGDRLNSLTLKAADLERLTK